MFGFPRKAFFTVSVRYFLAMSLISSVMIYQPAMAINGWCHNAFAEPEGRFNLLQRTDYNKFLGLSDMFRVGSRKTGYQLLDHVIANEAAVLIHHDGGKIIGYLVFQLNDRASTIIQMGISREVSSLEHEFALLLEQALSMLGVAPYRHIVKVQLVVPATHADLISRAKIMRFRSLGEDTWRAKNIDFVAHGELLSLQIRGDGQTLWPRRFPEGVVPQPARSDLEALWKKL